MYWTRKFQFFDYELVKDENEDSKEKGEPLNLFSGVNILSSTSGRGNLLFGDDMGMVYIVDREFRITSFQAHTGEINHLYQLKQSDVFISVGNEIQPLIKLWLTDKHDMEGKPICSQVLNPFSQINIPEGTSITCFSVLEDLSQFAIGFSNGLIMIFTGEIGRGRRIKTEILNKDKVAKGIAPPITSLHFRDDAKISLYVTTPNAIFSIFTNEKDYPIIMLDEEGGCDSKCSSLTEDKQLLVGKQQAAYFYDSEEKGPCFGIEGKKSMISWFSGYIIVVVEEPTEKRQLVTIFDRINKFIAFQHKFSDIVLSVLIEWGSIFILTKGEQFPLLYILSEKDLHQKMELLFKKKQYSIAISLANSSQQCDRSYVKDIFQMYGDHLYDKGDFDGAISQYVETIGYIEPSYVIRKFLDAQRIHNLTKYLQALHEQRVVSTDHTTLLLNCYTKLKDIVKLDKFVRGNYQFDVETAIKVLRQGGYFKHALYLATEHKHHDQLLKILIEDREDCDAALTYIGNMERDEVVKALRKHCRSLLIALPTKTTEFLKNLITSSNDEKKGQESFKAEEILHFFVSMNEYLQDFLEYIVIHDKESANSPLVWNTLLELLLRKYQNLSSSSSDISEITTKILNLLYDPKSYYDKDQALLLCQSHTFQSGVIFLYEKLALYQELLQLHINNNDHEAIIKTCERFDDPYLWVRALSYFAEQDDCHVQIGEVLSYIERDKLLPPLMVIQLLSQKGRNVPIALVREYLTRNLQSEHSQINEDATQIEAYKEDTAKMNEELISLKTSARTFNNTQCDACSAPLDLPAIHFLCMHSFHQRCLGENEAECSKCFPLYKEVLEKKEKMLESSRNHQQFFRSLETSADGFSTVSEYFSRSGIFDKTTESKSNK